MKTTRMIVTACLCLALAAGVSLATQVVPRTPQELARESSLVIDGKVTGVRSYWNADRSRILTEVTVSVNSAFKGAAAGAVRVVQPGGVVGNVRMTAHGALSWKRGEEVLLMLEPATPGAYQVAGFSQGKFTIARDARTGRAFVQQALPPDGDAPGAPAAAAAVPPRTTVEQFINQVLPRE